ncbi:MAG: hypothetical protein HOE90_04665 [Bacteriovoracaceae bacterium]|nr:hypothetical protein [Bacteriovoracaceae bacterium]
MTDLKVFSTAHGQYIKAQIVNHDQNRPECNPPIQIEVDFMKENKRIYTKNVIVFAESEGMRAKSSKQISFNFFDPGHPRELPYGKYTLYAKLKNLPSLCPNIKLISNYKVFSFVHRIHSVSDFGDLKLEGVLIKRTPANAGRYLNIVTTVSNIGNKIFYARRLTFKLKMTKEGNYFDYQKIVNFPLGELKTSAKKEFQFKIPRPSPGFYGFMTVMEIRDVGYRKEANLENNIFNTTQVVAKLPLDQNPIP